MRATLAVFGGGLGLLAFVALMVLVAALLVTSFTPNSETVTVPGETSEQGETPEQALRMVTLLPKDAIPAIFDPNFVSAQEADERFFAGDDLVIGLEIEGDARAYGIAHLSRHEIVNDVVGGKPVAVTW